MCAQNCQNGDISVQVKNMVCKNVVDGGASAQRALKTGQDSKDAMLRPFMNRKTKGLPSKMLLLRFTLVYHIRLVALLNWCWCPIFTAQHNDSELEYLVTKCSFPPKIQLSDIFSYPHMIGLKGIVSRDFGWLQMILMKKTWVPEVPLEVYIFLISPLI